MHDYRCLKLFLPILEAKVFHEVKPQSLVNAHYYKCHNFYPLLIRQVRYATILIYIITNKSFTLLWVL